jgi:uncharacterized membrane protein YfcA
MPWLEHLWLLPVGIAVGAFGTLIGAGGGFLLVPVLLLTQPHLRPEIITSISLACVFVNSASGSVAYAAKRRIDYRSALIFAAAAVPGAIGGAYATAYLPREDFKKIFAVMMLVGGTYLMISPVKRMRAASRASAGRVTRTLVDASGESHTWSFEPRIGIALSAVVGVLSSLLGIGGGIIHVPAMVQLLGFPVHVATATSHFVLALMSGVSVTVHAVQGDFRDELGPVVMLALGVVPGAQLGAKLSDRVHGTWILRGLAAALGIVGVRILLSG